MGYPAIRNREAAVAFGTRSLLNQKPSSQREGQGLHQGIRYYLSTKATSSLSPVMLQQREAAGDEVWNFQLLQQNKLSLGMLLARLLWNKSHQVCLRTNNVEKCLCNLWISLSLAVSLWSGVNALLQMPGRLHNGDRSGCMHLSGRWTVVSSKYFLLPQKVSTPRKHHPCNSTWGQLHCECKHHFVMCRRLYSGGSEHIYMQGIVLSALFYFAGSVEFKSHPLALISFWLFIAHNKKNAKHVLQNIIYMPSCSPINT